MLGSVPWTRGELLAELEEFPQLYERRPIRDNAGGMLSNHVFVTWFAARRLQPAVIVESGVFRGQGSWALDQRAPTRA